MWEVVGLLVSRSCVGQSVGWLVDTCKRSILLFSKGSVGCLVGRYVHASASILGYCWSVSMSCWMFGWQMYVRASLPGRRLLYQRLNQNNWRHLTIQTNVKKLNGCDHLRGHNPPCRIVHFQVQAVQDINKSNKLIQVPKFESNHIGMSFDRISK